METTLNISTVKYFTCQDCGGRFKVTITSMSTKPKYCYHCGKSKIKK